MRGEASAEVGKGACKVLEEQEEGGALIKAVFGVGGAEDGAAAAGEVVFFDDGDLNACVRETGCESDAADSSAWKELEFRVMTLVLVSIPTMIAVFCSGFDMDVRFPIRGHNPEPGKSRRKRNRDVGGCVVQGNTTDLDRTHLDACLLQTSCFRDRGRVQVKCNSELIACRVKTFIRRRSMVIVIYRNSRS